jgi:hypothetical protein
VISPSRRSSCAEATNADAVLRFSLARCSLAFSRRSRAPSASDDSPAAPAAGRFAPSPRSRRPVPQRLRIDPQRLAHLLASRLLRRIPLTDPVGIHPNRALLSLKIVLLRCGMIRSFLVRSQPPSDPAAIKSITQAPDGTLTLTPRTTEGLCVRCIYPPHYRTLAADDQGSLPHAEPGRRPRQVRRPPTRGPTSRRSPQRGRGQARPGYGCVHTGDASRDGLLPQHSLAGSTM